MLKVFIDISLSEEKYHAPYQCLEFLLFPYIMFSLPRTIGRQSISFLFAVSVERTFLVPFSGWGQPFNGSGCYVIYSIYCVTKPLNFSYFFNRNSLPYF